MKYLIHLHCYSNPKNKLQQAALEFLRTKDRLILDESEVESFSSKLKEDLQALNSQYPRCNPLREMSLPRRDALFNSLDNLFKKDQTIYPVDGMVIMHLYTISDLGVPCHAEPVEASGVGSAPKGWEPSSWEAFVSKLDQEYEGAKSLVHKILPHPSDPESRQALNKLLDSLAMLRNLAFANPKSLSK